MLENAVISLLVTLSSFSRCGAPLPIVPTEHEGEKTHGSTIRGDILAGPTVDLSIEATRRIRPTIVRRDFSGSIVRASAQPGRDALDAMDAARGIYVLNDAERKALERVSAARSAAFDALLSKNYRGIFALQNVSARITSAQLLVRIGAMSDLVRVLLSFKPYFDRGVFLDEFERADGVRATTVAHARELERRYFDTLVREAQVAQSGAQTGGQTDRQTDRTEFAIRTRLDLEHVGMLLKEAIEAKIAFAAAEFEVFARTLDLSGTQAEQVRTALTPLFLAKLTGDDSPAMQRDAYREVYALLEPQQRRAFLDFAAKQRALRAAK
jgi:hypothetical protein